MTAKDKLLSAFKKPNRRYKFRELMALCCIRGGELNKLIQELRHEGHQIVKGRFDKMYYLARIPTPYSNFFLLEIPQKGKLGIVSDTHLCSVAERLDMLSDAYNDFVKQGIDTVLHAGDLMDGWNVFKGHQQFIKTAGAQRQAQYCIKHYPQREGVKTYFISGNHDMRSFEDTGADQCSLVVNGFDFEGEHFEGRKDLIYLGQYSRTLMLPNEITVQLLHPRGSNPYALSYAQQKRAREMKSETRPTMQISGHMHTFCWILQDVTHMLSMPAFQDETEFFVRQGYSRQMGYCIMEYTLGDRLFERLKVEYISKN